MLEPTPQTVKDDKFGDVVTKRVAPTPQEDLERIAAERKRDEVQYALYKRGGRMLEATGHTYRENSGADPLNVEVREGSWADILRTLAENPKRFFKVTTDTFVGTNSDGDTRVPGITTIQKRLDEQAWKHGMVLGYKGVQVGETDNGSPQYSNDAFMLCFRTNVGRIPKRLRNLGLREDDFGSLTL